MHCTMHKLCAFKILGAARGPVKKYFRSKSDLFCSQYGYLYVDFSRMLHYLMKI